MWLLHCNSHLTNASAALQSHCPTASKRLLIDGLIVYACLEGAALVKFRQKAVVSLTTESALVQCLLSGITSVCDEQ